MTDPLPHPGPADSEGATPAEALAQNVADIKTMDIDEIVAALPAVRADNQKKAIALQQSGIQLDPIAVIMKRLESIVLMTDDDTRLRIEFTFETAMNAAMLDAEHDIRIATLTEGLGDLNNGRPQPRRPNTGGALPPRR